jgi:hypothetical protein
VPATVIAPDPPVANARGCPGYAAPVRSERIIARTGRRVWIGDIGANLQERSFIRVYLFREPRSLSMHRVRAKVMFLRYPNDVSHNAEGMIVDPRSRRLFVFEKQRSRQLSRVFGVSVRRGALRRLAPGTSRGSRPDGEHHGRRPRQGRDRDQELRRRAALPWSGGVVETLKQGHPSSVRLPSGEALAFSKSGHRISTVPEGSNPPMRAGGRIRTDDLLFTRQLLSH